MTAVMAPAFRQRCAPGCSWRDAMPTEVRLMVDAVAVAHRLTVSDLLSGSKVPKVVAARDHAIHMLRNRARKPSWPQIGLWFGRHHTSCMASYARHQRLEDERP